MNNFWLRKYEKSVTEVSVFQHCNNDKECYALSHFYQSKLSFCICFFNCQNCKCGQLSDSHIKRSKHKLYNYSYTYSYNVGLQLYTSRTYEFTYSYIFIFIPPESCYREISKFVI